MGSSTHPEALIANVVDKAYPVVGTTHTYPPVGGELQMSVICVKATIVLSETGLADKVNEYERPATNVFAGNEIGNTAVLATCSDVSVMSDDVSDDDNDTGRVA